MQEVINNPLFSGISGKLGNRIYRQINGRQVVSGLPKPSAKPPTQAQVAQRQGFRKAVKHAKRIIACWNSKAAFEQAAIRKNLSVFNVLVQDYLTGRKGQSAVSLPTRTTS
jgi:hypothetical protein